MKKLTNLIKLVEMTRTQPQYGYAMSGLSTDDLSNLAEHHYLVTFIGWQLSVLANQNGGNINTLKVVELCMTHDLGELFGGDIGRHYSIVNPEARKKAKEFEAENVKFISQYFDDSKQSYLEMMEEFEQPTSDEGFMAKMADWMECAHFLKYKNEFKPLDLKVLADNLPGFAARIKDDNARRIIGEYLTKWLKEIGEGGIVEILQGSKA